MVAIDRKMVDRDYQFEYIEIRSAEVSRGRRNLLVEMAAGTGKTRTAATFIKRLLDTRTRISRCLRRSGSICGRPRFRFPVTPGLRHVVSCAGLKRNQRSGSWKGLFGSSKLQ